MESNLKKRILLITVLMLLLCMLPLTAYANSPPPPGYFYVQIDNPPENAVFADILIKINAQSDGYTPFNSENGARHGITAESEIVGYDQNGYMSLSFHYSGVYSEMELGSFLCFEMVPASRSIDKITESLKVVLLDKDGNIVQISPPIDTIPPGNQFARELIYDADGTLFEIQFNDFYKGSAGFLFPIIILILGRMLLSVGVETLIAVPFKIRPLRKITLVNVITQIALIAFMGSSGLTYIHAMIIGEIFVYLAEGAAYMLMFKSVNKVKIIIYTITANTTTLIMGLIMNGFHI